MTVRKQPDLVRVTLVGGPLDGFSVDLFPANVRQGVTLPHASFYKVEPVPGEMRAHRYRDAGNGRMAYVESVSTR